MIVQEYDRVGRFLNDRTDAHGAWVEQVDVYVCSECASFTADPATHDEWHASLHSTT